RATPKPLRRRASVTPTITAATAISAASSQIGQPLASTSSDRSKVAREYLNMSSNKTLAPLTRPQTIRPAPKRAATLWTKLQKRRMSALEEGRTEVGSHPELTEWAACAPRPGSSAPSSARAALLSVDTDWGWRSNRG